MASKDNTTSSIPLLLEQSRKRKPLLYDQIANAENIKTLNENFQEEHSYHVMKRKRTGSVLTDTEYSQVDELKTIVDNEIQKYEEYIESEIEIDPEYVYKQNVDEIDIVDIIISDVRDQETRAENQDNLTSNEDVSSIENKTQIVSKISSDDSVEPCIPSNAVKLDFIESSCINNSPFQLAMNEDEKENVKKKHSNIVGEEVYQNNKNLDDMLTNETDSNTLLLKEQYEKKKNKLYAEWCNKKTPDENSSCEATVNEPVLYIERANNQLSYHNTNLETKTHDKEYNKETYNSDEGTHQTTTHVKKSYQNKVGMSMNEFKERENEKDEPSKYNNKVMINNTNKQLNILQQSSNINESLPVESDVVYTSNIDENVKSCLDKERRSLETSDHIYKDEFNKELSLDHNDTEKQTNQLPIQENDQKINALDGISLNINSEKISEGQQQSNKNDYLFTKTRANDLVSFTSNILPKETIKPIETKEVTPSDVSDKSILLSYISQSRQIDDNVLNNKILNNLPLTLNTILTKQTKINETFCNLQKEKQTIGISSNKKVTYTGINKYISHHERKYKQNLSQNQNIIYKTKNNTIEVTKDKISENKTDQIENNKTRPVEESIEEYINNSDKLFGILKLDEQTNINNCNRILTTKTVQKENSIINNFDSCQSFKKLDQLSQIIKTDGTEIETFNNKQRTETGETIKTALVEEPCIQNSTISQLESAKETTKGIGEAEDSRRIQKDLEGFQKDPASFNNITVKPITIDKGIAMKLKRFNDYCKYGYITALDESDDELIDTKSIFNNENSNLGNTDSIQNAKEDELVNYKTQFKCATMGSIVDVDKYDSKKLNCATEAKEVFDGLGLTTFSSKDNTCSTEEPLHAKGFKDTDELDSQLSFLTASNKITHRQNSNETCDFVINQTSLYPENVSSDSNTTTSSHDFTSSSKNNNNDEKENKNILNISVNNEYENMTKNSDTVIGILQYPSASSNSNNELYHDSLTIPFEEQESDIENENSENVYYLDDVFEKYSESIVSDEIQLISNDVQLLLTDIKDCMSSDIQPSSQSSDTWENFSSHCKEEELKGVITRRKSSGSINVIEDHRNSLVDIIEGLLDGIDTFDNSSELSNDLMLCKYKEKLSLDLEQESTFENCTKKQLGNETKNSESENEMKYDEDVFGYSNLYSDVENNSSADILLYNETMNVKITDDFENFTDDADIDQNDVVNYCNEVVADHAANKTIDYDSKKVFFKHNECDVEKATIDDEVDFKSTDDGYQNKNTEFDISKVNDNKDLYLDNHIVFNTENIDSKDNICQANVLAKYKFNNDVNAVELLTTGQQIILPTSQQIINPESNKFSIAKENTTHPFNDESALPFVAALINVNNSTHLVIFQNINEEESTLETANFNSQKTSIDMSNVCFSINDNYNVLDDILQIRSKHFNTKQKDVKKQIYLQDLFDDKRQRVLLENDNNDTVTVTDRVCLIIVEKNDNNIIGEVNQKQNVKLHSNIDNNFNLKCLTENFNESLIFEINEVRGQDTNFTLKDYFDNFINQQFILNMNIEAESYNENFTESNIIYSQTDTIKGNNNTVYGKDTATIRNNNVNVSIRPFDSQHHLLYLSGILKVANHTNDSALGSNTTNEHMNEYISKNNIITTSNEMVTTETELLNDNEVISQSEGNDVFFTNCSSMLNDTHRTDTEQGILKVDVYDEQSCLDDKEINSSDCESYNIESRIIANEINSECKTSVENDDVLIQNHANEETADIDNERNHQVKVNIEPTLEQDIVYDIKNIDIKSSTSFNNNVANNKIISDLESKQTEDINKVSKNQIIKDEPNTNISLKDINIDQHHHLTTNVNKSDNYKNKIDGKTINNNDKEKVKLSENNFETADDLSKKNLFNQISLSKAEDILSENIVENNVENEILDVRMKNEFKMNVSSENNDSKIENELIKLNVAEKISTDLNNQISLDLENCDPNGSTQTNENNDNELPLLANDLQVSKDVLLPIVIVDGSKKLLNDESKNDVEKLLEVGQNTSTNNTSSNLSNLRLDSSGTLDTNMENGEQTKVDVKHSNEINVLFPTSPKPKTRTISFKFKEGEEKRFESNLDIPKNDKLSVSTSNAVSVMTNENLAPSPTALKTFASYLSLADIPELKNLLEEDLSSSNVKKWKFEITKVKDKNLGKSKGFKIPIKVNKDKSWSYKVSDHKENNESSCKISIQVLIDPNIDERMETETFEYNCSMKSDGSIGDWVLVDCTRNEITIFVELLKELLEKDKIRIEPKPKQQPKKQSCNIM